MNEEIKGLKEDSSCNDIKGNPQDQSPQRKNQEQWKRTSSQNYDSRKTS